MLLLVNTTTVETKSEGHCGHWVIRGKCSKGDNCKFKHEPSMKEKKTPEMVAFYKGMPCKDGAACKFKDTTCMFGHDAIKEE